MAITPEQVLGEYWNDPLFGAASTDTTVRLELLHKRIWPQVVRVGANQNIRFVIENRTGQKHLIAFSANPDELISDRKFKKFADDELFHATQKRDATHRHEHGGGSVDDAEAIVKKIDQRPTVFLNEQGLKETLIRFEESGRYFIFCALDDHFEEGFVADLFVEHVLNQEK